MSVVKLLVLRQLPTPLKDLSVFYIAQNIPVKSQLFLFFPWMKKLRLKDALQR